MKQQKILVWLSGGVDSAVSAYLLRQQWYDVTAWFMINYLAPEWELCPTKEDLVVAKEVAEFLEIPFFTFDYREEYEEKVLNYMYEWYKKWITPNPDIMCNSEIKFKIFLDEALELWFDAVATGHYARIIRSRVNLSSHNLKLSLNSLPFQGKEATLWSVEPLALEKSKDSGKSLWLYEDQNYFKLLKWIDEIKDQSYFLAWLSQEQLSKALFPIGHLQKSEVREIAQKIGLPNAERKDSQGICFVWKVDMKEFLQKKIPNSQGNVIDVNGKILWKHKWVFYYTIGQRKWVDIWGQSEPIFVIKKDIQNNTLIMGTSEDQELYSDSLYISKIHFLWETRDFPHTCKAKIRYRQEDQDCEITEISQWYQVRFTKPLRAIASGQIVAFYDGDELWGSGIIN